MLQDCGWKEECRSIKKIFKHNDSVLDSDASKGNFFIFNLEGGTPKQIVWRLVALETFRANTKVMKSLKNLSAAPSLIISSIGAFHFWT